jgi:hypothetical protein
VDQEEVDVELVHQEQQGVQELLIGVAEVVETEVVVVQEETVDLV